MGKTTDTFFESKFWLPQNSPFQAKTCAAGRANNVELSMLVLNFMVKHRLKNTRWNFCGIHGMSERECVEEKYDTFCTSRVGTI